MLEYTFRIRHRGCWTETVNDHFPNVTATIVYSYRLLGVSITMVEMTNVSGEEIDPLVAWLSEHEVMTDAQLITYDPDKHTALVSLAGDYSTDTEPVLNVLLRNRCFPTVPATVTNGREYWTVLTSDHERVTQTHEELERMGSVDVDSLKRPGVDRMLTGLIDIKQAVQDLSPRQREILVRAVDEGYYDSPRSCRLEDLAEGDPANTSTVGEHLRRSEAKILTTVAKQLQETETSDEGSSRRRRAES